MSLLLPDIQGRSNMHTYKHLKHITMQKLSKVNMFKVNTKCINHKSYMWY